MRDERVMQLLAAWGVPYVFGAGQPADAMTHWPGGVRSTLDHAPEMEKVPGWDCSGFAQCALVAIGMLSPKASDRGAARLYADGQSMAEVAASMGDLAFYGRPTVEHVMVYLGDGVVLGATGGRSTTFGKTPTAYVDLKPVRYRSDFLGFRRVRG